MRLGPFNYSWLSWQHAKEADWTRLMRMVAAYPEFWGRVAEGEAEEQS